MIPSRSRVAGTGLAIAALTIVALALLARFELDREAALHREVIAALEVKDSLEALRTQLNDLRAAARLAAQAPNAEAARTIAHRVVEVDAELAYLAEQRLRLDAAEAFEALAQSARLLSIAASSIASRSAADPAALVAEVERVGTQAHTALERTLRVQRRRINESTIAQLRVGETLRGYVGWLLAGSIAVLVGLAGFYRWARLREARALQRIEHLAHHDLVTGLPNRALLTERLAQELARARREEASLAVMMLDLDGFKTVNDTWGHAAGDAVLAQVAERLRACMRTSDIAGRMGGDEFMALLPHATEEGALKVAEKARHALREPYRVAGGGQALLGASVGIAFFPRDGMEPDALQQAADAALYDAKRSGKDRVAVARTRVPEEAPEPA